MHEHTHTYLIVSSEINLFLNNPFNPPYPLFKLIAPQELMGTDQILPCFEEGLLIQVVDQLFGTGGNTGMNHPDNITAKFLPCH